MEIPVPHAPMADLPLLPHARLFIEPPYFLALKGPGLVNHEIVHVIASQALQRPFQLSAFLPTKNPASILEP